MRFLKWIFIGAVVVCLTLTALLYVNQRSLQYFPPDLYITPHGVGLDDFQEVTSNVLLSEDAEGENFNVKFWYHEPAISSAPVVMFFHGNASAVYSSYPIFEVLAAQGYGVLSVAYPGYPGSEGTLTQHNVLQAAKHQHQWLINQGIEEQHIVYYGHSLGSGVAAQLAAIRPPALLVMDAPFNSMLDMAKIRFPFLPADILLKDKFRSDYALKRYKGQMVWLHGKADRVVPYAQGQKLYDGYDGPKVAYVFGAGRHTNLWEIGGREVVLSRLRERFPFILTQNHADVERR